MIDIEKLRADLIEEKAHDCSECEMSIDEICDFFAQLQHFASYNLFHTSYRVGKTNVVRSAIDSLSYEYIA